MLLLTLVPFVFSLMLSALLLWWGLAPLNAWLDHTLSQNEGARVVQGLLAWSGIGVVRAAILSMLAMWLLLPVTILAALVFVGLWAMPAINRHVAQKHFSRLLRCHGGSLWSTLWISIISLPIFVFLWLVTLPLSVVPPFTFLIHPVLWGWLTYRVMAYDALAEHATRDERRELMHAHRWSLLLIGTIVGVFGAVPTLLWLGGAFSVILLPILATVATWLYVAVFVFSGLWFQHYCLEALTRLRLRAQPTAMPSPVPLQ